MKKLLFILLIFFLVVPFVHAQEQHLKDILLQLSLKKPESLKMAIEDMKKLGNVDEKKFSEAVSELEINHKLWIEQLSVGNTSVLSKVEKTLNIIDGVMLSNPLLTGKKLIYIRREIKDARKNKFPENMGFPSLNSHNHTNIFDSQKPWFNQIMIMDDISNIEAKSRILYKPEKPVLVTDLEIDFDANKVLFSSIDHYNRWSIFEKIVDDSNAPTLVTPDDNPDINRFDACYLPDGNIIFTSDASYQGLPCEGGSRPMAQIFFLNRTTGKIRQLTYEQDSDWCPIVLNNGRVMYLRWEYSDISHYFSRILMSMNPDGTNQIEYYGSNSYFPTAFFYPRPIPGHPTKVVGVVGGHHGVSRSGRLMIIDPEISRREAEGVVQEIPYRGRKVEPTIKDRLVDNVLPHFLHPYPLNENYFLVSAKMANDGLWGLYLVDTFDNITLIKQEEDVALFDPILLKAQPTPPIIPERIDLKNPNANVFISDIYEGEGLKGIPRGTVKKLRLFSYHFAHMQSGGHQTVGIESSWDIKRILGVVDVEEDGSAFFTVPANTPISIQPLDSSGRALQLMRSWFVGMPGENVSCTGCHEQQNSVVPNRLTIVSRNKPKPITSWYGNPRPFSFRYEVQPVLDRKCVVCHNGTKTDIPDFCKAKKVDYKGKSSTDALFFEETGYLNLHPYVFRPGPESDNAVVVPMEYHASVSELIQKLQRGHKNVKLSQEEWERIYAWIDLNVPYRGKWAPPAYNNQEQQERRLCLTSEYAGMKVDPEAEFDSLVAIYEGKEIVAERPQPSEKLKNVEVKVDGWPMNQLMAEQLQANLRDFNKRIDLGNGKGIDLVKIPAGKFVAGGGKSGYDDELVQRMVSIEKPFWMGTLEISNEIYALFDATHNSRYIDQHWKDHSTPGYPANKPNQPVIRISQQEAMAFCKWLSEKTGLKCELPSEDQWEWACRAGSDNHFWFGDQNADYSMFENLADYSVRKFPVTWNNPGNPLRFIGNEDGMMKYYDFIPRDNRFDDNNMIVADVDSYYHNPWGLYNMHGNVAEWTSSKYKKGSNDFADNFYTEDMVVVKGGSWRDRPSRSGASAKRYYESFQKPFNVGFRIIVTE